MVPDSGEGPKITRLATKISKPAKPIVIYGDNDKKNKFLVN